MWPIVHERCTSKTKLSCHDKSYQVWYRTKTKHDNNMTDHIGLVYVENKIELLWLIWQGVIWERNQLEQWCDWTYRWSMLKTILNCRDSFDWVLSMTRTKHANVVSDHTYAVYVENETKFSYQIKLGVVSNENQTRQRLRQNRNWTFKTYLTEWALWWKQDRTMMWLIV